MGANDRNPWAAGARSRVDLGCRVALKPAQNPRNPYRSQSMFINLSFARKNRRIAGYQPCVLHKKEPYSTVGFDPPPLFTIAYFYHIRTDERKELYSTVGFDPPPYLPLLIMTTFCFKKTNSGCPASPKSGRNSPTLLAAPESMKIEENR